MRVLVCGGRRFSDIRLLAITLREFKPRNSAVECSETIIIHGDAPGADKMADEWCETFGIRKRVYPANWKRDGRAAGPIRNQRMIDEGKPDIVIAFPGGRGTADMVRRARAAGIKVREIAAQTETGRGR